MLSNFLTVDSKNFSPIVQLISEFIEWTNSFCAASWKKWRPCPISWKSIGLFFLLITKRSRISNFKRILTIRFRELETLQNNISDDHRQQHRHTDSTYSTANQAENLPHFTFQKHGLLRQTCTWSKFWKIIRNGEVDFGSISYFPITYILYRQGK